MEAYNGDQMARELGVEAKHAVEKLAAHTATTFATVSKLTAREAKQLLEREPVVLPNGFRCGSSPFSSAYRAKRKKARKRLSQVASRLYHQEISSDEAFFISLGGRYEYRNKGIDLYLESLYRFRESYQGLAPNCSTCSITLQRRRSKPSSIPAYPIGSTIPRATEP